MHSLSSIALNGTYRHTGGYLLGISLLVLGINWLLTRWNKKNGIIQIRISDNALGNFRKYSGIFLLVTAFGSQIYTYWFTPSVFIALILMAAVIALFILLFQFIRMPDWIFRNRRVFINAFFMIFAMGVVIVALVVLEPGIFSKMAWWMIPIPAIFVAVFFFSLISQSIRWKRLKKATPYTGERADTISAEGCLIYSAEEEADNSNTGRILLFPDHLVFVPKEGPTIPVPFDSVQNVGIHREWRALPVGLELTGYSGEMRYLSVMIPYYWKWKIENPTGAD